MPELGAETHHCQPGLACPSCRAARLGAPPVRAGVGTSSTNGVSWRFTRRAGRKLSRPIFAGRGLLGAWLLSLMHSGKPNRAADQLPSNDTCMWVDLRMPASSYVVHPSGQVRLKCLRAGGWRCQSLNGSKMQQPRPKCGGRSVGTIREEGQNLDAFWFSSPRRIRTVVCTSSSPRPSEKQNPSHHHVRLQANQVQGRRGPCGPGLHGQGRDSQESCPSHRAGRSRGHQAPRLPRDLCARLSRTLCAQAAARHHTLRQPPC
jgi:hypothetical protein